MTFRCRGFFVQWNPIVKVLTIEITFILIHFLSPSKGQNGLSKYTLMHGDKHTHTQTQWLKAIQQQQMWRLKNYRHIANTNNPFFIFVFEQTMQL